MDLSKIISSLRTYRFPLWTLIFAVFFILSRYNYLLFHDLAEMFSIIVAGSIFLISWNTRKLLQQHFLLFIGIGFAYVVVFNALHVITYTGMNVIPADTNLTTQFFIIAQYFTGFTLLIAPFFLKRKLPVPLIFTIYSVISFVLLLSVFWWRVFPACYLPGSAFTPFEQISEYMVALLLALTIIILEKNRGELAPQVLNLILTAVIFLVFSSLALGFTNVLGFLNFMGHFLRIISFYFLYKAFIVTSLVEPYSGLFMKLRDSEQRYRSIYDTAPLAFVIWDRNHCVTGWNKTATQIFGWSESEVLGRDFFDLIIPESVRGQVNEIVDALLVGTAQNRSINENVTKSGKIIICEWNNQVLRDSEGNIENILSLGLDITEQKAAERLLEETSEKIKKFAYFVAHDLKNPAISMYGLARLLKKQYSKSLDDKGRNLCDQIMKTAEQIGSLVDDINTYISTKELPMKIEEVDLKELVSNIRDEFTIRLSSRAITLTESENLPTMRTERMFMLRALRNLVDNALKYGGEQLTEIRIEYRDSGDKHTLIVSDNGFGLRAEDLQKIFSPFVRKIQTHGVAGTGLGLAIVKEFASRLNGEVWAESNYGKGATFFISLPKKL